MANIQTKTCVLKILLVACVVIILMVVVGIEQETKRRSIVQNPKVFNISNLHEKLRMS